MTKKRAPPSSLERLVEPLRLREPCGTYAVDAYAGVMFLKTDQATAIEATRREINRAAQIAVVREQHERVELRKARDLAQRLDKLLENLQRDAAGWFPSGDDVAAIAADIAQGFTGPKDSSVATPLVQIIEDINSLRSWAVELRRFDIVASPPSRSDPLARHFVQAMATAYLASHGKQPPRSRESPFVTLVAAGWSDLGFPPPPSDTPLEDWLGAKVERLYRI